MSRKTEQTTTQLVNLDAVRAETAVYHDAADAAERLIAARRTLAEMGASVEIPALPDGLSMDDVLDAFAETDPVTERRQ
ncbi:hypothetical protein FE374_05130 [Georgenia yuyongxinii]|uniref:Uncharacterized protein n=1 Tax=Georgenia yuyongxinii TaxID=2589797 RepID=A0A5B8C468_9MICO|nr:hypothetical protein [Georgenia yuyongxinii]QDC24095.1 hypothetical protein FE374_05130 [Georgenia yuyongxinii]